jgi:AcrR family transcriptional regulator
MARSPAPGTRDTILTAAAGLFYEYGVRAVGMAQVVEAAGCGKNLLYRHFPSKAELAAAYLTLTRQERERSVAEALRWYPDPAGQLTALVGEIADIVRRPGYRGCPFRNYLTEFPGDDDEPARVARSYLADTRAQLDRLVFEIGRREQTDGTGRHEQADGTGRHEETGGAGLLADRIWLIVNGLHTGPAAQAQVAVDWVAELISAGAGGRAAPGAA